jgi:SAM-dependent methyltransferase
MSRSGGYGSTPELAEIYDFVPPYAKRADLNFYVELCRSRGGSVLELGCGTGRVMIPIARAGCSITGLDLSEHMLARCRQNLKIQPTDIRDRVHTIQADMTDFALGEQFDTIIIPFRPLQHILSLREQMACLACAHRHLREGGILAFDVFQLSFPRISDPSIFNETEDIPEFELPDGRRMRRTSRLVAAHRAEQYNDFELIYHLTGPDGETERVVHAFPFRYYFRYELEHLLARTGFVPVAVYGGFDKSAMTDDSTEMVFVAQKS